MNIFGLGHNKEKKDILKPEGYQRSTFSLLLCTLAISILSLALPVMTLQVYDRILPNPGTGTLSVLIAGVCLAVILEAMLRLSRDYVIGRASATYEHRMACKAMNKILGADMTRIGSYGIGEHLHRMSAVGKLKDFYSGYALIVLAELAFVPIFFGLIVYISGVLAFVPLSVLGIFIMVSFWRGYRLRHALHMREDVDDKRFNFLIESLEGVHTLKAFALEKFFERRYEALEEDSTRANYVVTQETSATFNTGAIFSHIMVALVITVGAWFVLNGLLSTGGLIAILLLSGRMMQPVQKALALWARYQDFAISRDKIEELFTTPQKVMMSRENETDPLADGRIEMQNVTFQYPGEDVAIMKNINLEMKRGDAILLSGAHGSGKTTLLNIMTGILTPDEGEIILDGENLNTYHPEELVRHVGFIRSEPLIFSGSIRDNITCFGQTKEAQAREVAALLDVDKDVAKLPSGFDTFVSGSGTDNITAGLKQRIAIVRVLATKPRLIFFDNADRSLDREGYAMIYSLLARLKGKASMVLISDDRNIQALAERHYILRNGELQETAMEYSYGNIRPYKELRL